jgi:hypothetical protein
VNTVYLTILNRSELASLPPLPPFFFDFSSPSIGACRVAIAFWKLSSLGGRGGEGGERNGTGERRWEGKGRGRRKGRGKIENRGGDKGDRTKAEKG